MIACEQIVEVVRDAARELADRLHLLRLRELGLERLLLGGVDEIEDRLRRAVGRGAERAREELRAAIGGFGAGGAMDLLGLVAGLAGGGARR